MRQLHENHFTDLKWWTLVHTAAPFCFKSLYETFWLFYKTDSWSNTSPQPRHMSSSISCRDKE